MYRDHLASSTGIECCPCVTRLKLRDALRQISELTGARIEWNEAGACVSDPANLMRGWLTFRDTFGNSVHVTFNSDRLQRVDVVKNLNQDTAVEF